MTVIATVSSAMDEDLTDEESALLQDFRSEGITAVACWRDWSASRVLVYCQEHKIQVPEDLAVVGFDGLTPYFCPPNFRLTTVAVEWERIAETAVEMLLKVIEGTNVPDEVLQPCTLYIGNTS
jgi:DNA-binding LacI/PurR family transcriptional regulator